VGKYSKAIVEQTHAYTKEFSTRWIAEFKRRYLDLELSEEEWKNFKRHD